MKEMTLEQFYKLSKKERLEYNLKVFANAEFNEDGMITNIQYYYADGNWIDKEGGEITSGTMYRIKPEPEYKPYDTVKHEWICKVVRWKTNASNHNYSAITEINEYDNTFFAFDKTYNLEAAFNDLEWQDGSPFGEK